jgi:hypothetical protein
VEALPDDDLDIAPELAIGEEEDLYVASLNDVHWHDNGMQSFLATLPSLSKSNINEA